MSTQKSVDLRSRTKAYALRIVRLYQDLPKSGEAKVIGNLSSRIRRVRLLVGITYGGGNCSYQPIVGFAKGD